MELKDYLAFASFGVNLILLAYGYGRLTNKVEGLEGKIAGSEKTLKEDTARLFKHTGDLFGRVTELDKDNAGQKQINVSVKELLEKMDGKLDRLLGNGHSHG